MLLYTFSDILKAIAMAFPPTALRISFCEGILDLVKENIVICPHLNPYISFLHWH